MQRIIALSLLIVSASFCNATAQTQVERRLLPAPELKITTANGWFAETRGRLEMDAVHIEDDQANHRAGIDERRLRLGLDAGYGKEWAATFEMDFSSDDPEYTDILLRYHNQENLHLSIGHFKEAFGMERIQSSQSTLFNERAAIDTFSPKRNLGVQATRYNDHGSFTLGAFTDSMVTNSNKDKFALVSRGTYAFSLAGGTLHSGLAGSWRKMDSASFSAFPDTATTDIRTLSTGRLYDADRLAQGGLEAAYAVQNFLLSGEYMLTHLERETAGDATFDGWYTQAAWVLTGEPYQYSVAKNAIFQPVKPQKPFSLAQGTWGAFELAARYQTLSLSGGSVQAGHMQAVSGGVNWYLNNQWRITGDVTYVESDAESVTPQDNPVVSALRVRVAF